MVSYVFLIGKDDVKVGKVSMFARRFGDFLPHLSICSNIYTAEGTVNSFAEGHEVKYDFVCKTGERFDMSESNIGFFEGNNLVFVVFNVSGKTIDFTAGSNKCSLLDSSGVVVEYEGDDHVEPKFLSALSR